VNDVPGCHLGCPDRNDEILRWIGDDSERAHGTIAVHGRALAVSADDLTIARQFLATLATVANTGERELLYPFLAADVEWVTPRRDLAGIDEVREELTWITAPENFDLEFEATQMTDLGDGRIVTDVRELYRVRGTGDVAHSRDRRVELTIRDAKVVRYEMRIVG
jgi:hypothetical protein